jgi:hypothetical protein
MQIEWVISVARLKVTEISGKVNTGNVVRASQLALPMSLATLQASGFKMFGDEATLLYASQKKEEDTNEATAITNNLAPQLISQYNQFSNNTNMQVALEGFNEAVDYKNFADLGSNKNVKKQVRKFVTDFQRKYSLDLLANVTQKHKELTSANKQQKLNLLIKDMSGSDVGAAEIASRNYNSFWINPQNLEYYGAKKLEELKAKSDLQIIELTMINKAERGEINLLNNEDRAALLASLPAESQKVVIDQIRNKNLSESIRLDEEKIFSEKQDKQVKIKTFITALLAINDHRLNPSEETISKVPTINNLYDLKNSGALNSSQYETLLRFKAEGGRSLSSSTVEQIVDAEFALADTIERFDEIQESINLDPDVTKNLSPESIIKYNKLFEAYKKNQTFAQDDKHFRELLKIGSKKIVTTGGFNFGFQGKKTDLDFLVRAEARMKEYDDLVLNKNFKPEQAYEEVIKKLSKDELPELHDLKQPSSVSINDLKKELNDNPKDTFINLRKDAAIAFKKHGNIDIYKEDIKLIDRIEDVYDVRLFVNEGDIGKALGKKLRIKK